MTTLQQVPIRAHAGGKEAEGYADAKVWNAQERQKRAWRGLGLTWGLAIASIFLPLVHFVLVPAFFLAGPFVFFWFKKQAGKVHAVRAPCPHCQKSLTNTAELPLENSFRTVCYGCYEPVRIDLLDKSLVN